MLLRLALVLTVLLAGVYVAGGVSFIIGYASGSMDWDPSVLEALMFGAIPIAAAPMVLWGLYVSKQSTRLGPGLVIVGTMAVTAAWFWFFFALVPLSIVVIAFAIVRARKFSKVRQAPVVI